MEREERSYPLLGTRGKEREDRSLPGRGKGLGMV